MGVVKRIVCLANSRKMSGRCIAGIELGATVGPRWVRPVGADECAGVSEYDRQYQDGSDPRVLDVIAVSLVAPRPKSYQTENWLLDPNFYWVKEREAPWAEVARLVDPGGPLWQLGFSTVVGLNDRVPLACASGLPDSLRLIRLPRMVLVVCAPGEDFGNPKRKVYGYFVHDGQDYRLTVTDPVIERKYLALANGTYELGECLVTVSLGEPFNDYCYKLIAAILPAGAS